MFLQAVRKNRFDEPANGAFTVDSVILGKIYFPRLNGRPEIRSSARQVLNDPKASYEAKKDAVYNYAFTYAGELSYGAVRLLILKGIRTFLKVESSLCFVEEGREMAYSPLLPPGSMLGSELEALVEKWEEWENRLAHFPTLGGKLRGVNEDTERWGFPEGSKGLFRDEDPPALLWPLLHPEMLAETVSHLVHFQDSPYKLNLTFSGTVGESRKLGALAVYGILPYEYPLPENLGDEDREHINIGWFAPIVDGGKRGVMGQVKLDGRPNPKLRRHDYLFIEFEPPSVGNNEWRQAFLKFAQKVKPKIIKTDPDTGAITFEMWFEGEIQRGVLFPSAEEVRRIQENEDYYFPLSLFLTLARKAHRDELLKVAEAAWAMAILADFKDELAIGDLAMRFERRMTRFLHEAGVADILNVRWVGNTNWTEIRDSMLRYQTTLRE